jgi:pilus assembly protein Flp/PilA
MRLPAIYKKILRCTSGTSSIEYGMILAVFVLLMLVALQVLADETSGMWADISAKSSHAMNGN